MDISSMLFSLVKNAVNDRATDVMVFPHSHGGRIFVRVDGVRRYAGEISVNDLDMLIVRAKDVAAMDLTLHSGNEFGEYAHNGEEGEYSVCVAIFRDQTTLKLLSLSILPKDFVVPYWMSKS